MQTSGKDSLNVLNDTTLFSDRHTQRITSSPSVNYSL